MACGREPFCLEVPCDVRAPGKVRSELAAIYDGGWPLGDGLLVASELVTNAVQHSGCEETDQLRVEVAHQDGHLLISVRDPGFSRKVAAPAEPDLSTPGGLGLWIVEQLSERWGAERASGYRVWAELPAERPVIGA